LNFPARYDRNTIADSRNDSEARHCHSSGQCSSAETGVTVTTFTTFVSLNRLTAMLATGAFMLVAADGTAAKSAMVKVPAALNPDKLSIFRVVSAMGVQVYTCTRNPSGTAGWNLKGPDAQLFDSHNKPVGKHYAGPTWEGFDGGKVVGGVRTSMPAPLDGAIPWLLLDIKSREGSGTFTEARAIVRMGTTGGATPPDGCDEVRAGRELRVPYTAIYVLLK
jgi:hypothetical protein